MTMDRKERKEGKGEITFFVLALIVLCSSLEFIHCMLGDGHIPYTFCTPSINLFPNTARVQWKYLKK